MLGTSVYAETRKELCRRWTINDDKRAQAEEIRPRRRDDPLRYENVRDDEVKEIESAARSVIPKSIVNISGVVTGCPCADGATCTDQVWVLASRADMTFGLLLSKIGGHWLIGPVQEWWISYEKLKSRRSRLTYSEYEAAEQHLLEQLPSCGPSAHLASGLATCERY